MFLALVGAVLALVTLGRWHDRQLRSTGDASEDGIGSVA